MFLDGWYPSAYDITPKKTSRSSGLKYVLFDNGLGLTELKGTVEQRYALFVWACIQ